MNLKRMTVIRCLTIAAVVAPAIALVLFGLFGCGNKSAGGPSGSSPADDDLPRVETFTVKQQNLLQKIELPGTVEGI